MSDKPKSPEGEKPARVRSVRPKYQVFVSSTFVDLHEERKAVTWEILKAGHIPVGMENFSAYDDRGWKVINRTLETTDYYVLILAGRYGSIDDSIGMSWTEREYRTAIELGIPVLAFIREKKYIPGDQVDTDEKAKKLADLIADVSGKRLRETWTTPDDLRAKVSLALLKALAEDEAEGSARPGWYRGNQLPSPATMDELAHLSAENRKLRGELDSVQKRAATAIIPYMAQANVGGQVDGMYTLFCDVENHGETPFRFVEEEATWWLIEDSGTPATKPKPAELRVQQRFAKPGEKCSVYILLPMSQAERSDADARLKRDRYTSPVEAELTVTCENAAGNRKTERKVVRLNVAPRPRAD